MRRLENVDEEKFWEAWIKDDLIFCYRYGKIGSAGHTKLKKFKTRGEAEAELEAKLAEKLDEGFDDPSAEEEEKSEGGDSDEDAEESEKDADAEEDEATGDDAEEDAEEEDAGDDDDEQDEDDESDADEASDEDDESDDDEESDDEEDEDEEHAAPRKKRRATAAVVVEAPPPKPSLPARVKPSAPTPEKLQAAVTALDALRVATTAGARSWKLARLARRARHALERLGGVALTQHEDVARALDAVTALVLAPTKRLPLEDALTMLWVVDAATYARTVALWRARMLDSSAAPSIGVLSAVFEQIPDQEVAVHVGAALVNRRLSPDAFQYWFSRIKPFLVESVAKASGGFDALRAALKPGNDALLRARVAEVVP